MINTDKPARMGQYVKQHKPVFNRHTIIHSFRRNHFAFAPSAIITQQKKIPDVSFWQGMIDWDKMRSKTDAVIIRAGQGYWGTDSQWLNNWGKAKERGMLRGCYWFYDDRESPGAQAARLVNQIKDDRPEMEVVIDWETYYGGNYGGLREVVAMMQEVERLAPWVKLGFYSGFYWYTGNTNPISNASQYNYLKDKPLWLAWYTNDASLVRIPAPWDSLWMWQFGTPPSGLDYGVRTAEIDMNYFNGTEAEFYQRYEGVTPPPPTNGDAMYQCKTKSTATPHVNLRAAASLTSDDIGNIFPLTSFVADALTNGYLHAINPFIGYVAAQYCDYEVITITPPPADTKAVSVTVALEGYRPLTLSGEMEAE